MMEERFLDFVAEIMNVNTEEISMDTEYKKYSKWDSLMMMTLIMEIEAEYGISIPIETAGKIRTLRDFYKLTEG